MTEKLKHTREPMCDDDPTCLACDVVAVRIACAFDPVSATEKLAAIDRIAVALAESTRAPAVDERGLLATILAEADRIVDARGLDGEGFGDLLKWLRTLNPAVEAVELAEAKWFETVTCPQCGQVYESSEPEYDGDEREVNCLVCEKTFGAHVSVKIAYQCTSLPAPPKEPSRDE